MAETKGTMLKPSEMIEGGGLLSDADVTFKEVSFDMNDYNGKATPAPAIKVVMETEDGEEAIQFWSVGGAKDWMPSPDGKKLIPCGSATALRANTNGAIFLASMVNAGYPEDKISDDISCFTGLVCHVQRVPAPKRSGMTKTPRADGKEFVQEILIVETIHSYPWDAKGKGKGKKVAASKGGNGKAVDDKLTGQATDLMLGILAENPQVAKASLPGLIFGALADEKDVNKKSALVRLIYGDDAFLSAGPWKYEDGVVSL